MSLKIKIKLFYTVENIKIQLLKMQSKYTLLTEEISFLYKQVYTVDF